MSRENFTPPAPAAETGPEMSTPDTLANIFFDPGTTFEALRRRPRFLAAGLIIVAFALLVTVVLLQKVDLAQFMAAQIEKSPQAAQMTPEQKEQAVALWAGPVGKVVFYVLPLVFTVILIVIGALVFMLGAMLTGGKMSFKQALSVFVYSRLPPTVLNGILSAVIIFLKPAEEIDLNKAGEGLAVSNLGALINPASPVLRAALGWFDIFTFYWMFLAALGLRKVGKISSGSAWAIVIAIWLCLLVLSVARAALFPTS